MSPQSVASKKCVNRRSRLFPQTFVTMDKVKTKFRDNPEFKLPTEIKGSVKGKSRGNYTKSSLILSRDFSQNAVEDSLPKKNGFFLEELITNHDSSVNESINQYESNNSSCTGQVLYGNLTKRKLSVDNANSITPQALVNHNDANLTRHSIPCLRTPSLNGSYENEGLETGNVYGSKVMLAQSTCTEAPTDDLQNQYPLQGKMINCDNLGCCWSDSL